MKIKSSLHPSAARPAFPLPTPGDIVVWTEDNDVMLCIPRETAGGRQFRLDGSPAEDNDFVLLFSIKNRQLYPIPPTRCRQYAAPATPVSANQDGTINFARE